MPLQKTNFCFPTYYILYNTNMTKHCAVNLNARYRLNFKYLRVETYVFRKKSV